VVHHDGTKLPGSAPRHGRRISDLDRRRVCGDDPRPDWSSLRWMVLLPTTPFSHRARTTRPVRLGSQPQLTLITACGRDHSRCRRSRRSDAARETPKEQPPGKLSGTCTASAGNSGEQSPPSWMTHRRGKPTPLCARTCLQRSTRNSQVPQQSGVPTKARSRRDPRGHHDRSPPVT